ncbi:MAG: hypothetical protein EA349_04700, partial [Halomonadaceae bacterium]
MAGFLKQLFASRKPQTPTATDSREQKKNRNSQPAASPPEKAEPRPPRPTDTPELLAINGATAAERLTGVEQLDDPEAL